jgi:hypothetical protein
MPQGETVRVQTSDGKLWDIPRQNLAVAMQRGAKVYNDPGGTSIRPPSRTEKFESDVVSGMGMDPGEVKQSSWTDLIRGAASGTGEWLKATALDPYHITDPIEAIAGNLERGIRERNPAKIIGALSTIAMGMEAVERGPAAAKTVARPPLRSYIGIGKTAENFAKTEAAQNFAKLKNDHAELAKKIAQENAGELAKSRDVERQKFSEVETKRSELARQTQAENQSALAKARDTERQQIDQLEKDHTAATEQARSKTEASRSAVAERQRLTTEAQKVSQVLGDSLQTIRSEETAVAKALYPEISGKSDAATIQQGLQKAVDDHLLGSDRVPTVIARILKDTSEVPGKSTGPAIQGRTLDLSNPNDLAAYQRYKSQGVFSPKEIARIEGGNGGGISFDDLHGYYSELGRGMFDRDLPGDERAAYAAGRKFIGDQLEQLAAKENKAYRFGVAQQNWAKLENTWYNTGVKNGSPIARVLQAIDPVTKKVRPEYVQSILSEPKSYEIAQQMLSRYKSASNAQSALQLMMKNLQEARRLPKIAKEFPGPKPIEYPKSTAISLKATPEGPEYPKSTSINLKETPPEPTHLAFDPVEWRLKMIREKAKQLSGGFGRYESRPYGARYTPIQRMIARFLASPEVQKWLAGAK